jgi:hypothetical protein
MACGAASYHPGDVAARYCFRCHVFHDGPVARAALEDIAG